MSDQDELVRLAIAGSVATVTLDSPANRNALSRRLVGELEEHLAQADAHPDVRVIVLTHTGSTFCAGADLAEAVRDGMERGTRALLDLLRTVAALPTPVVALVRGHVRAGGVGLVGACDLALVSDSASFAFTEVRLGLAPAIISLTTRSRLSDREAARLYLTGEAFDGATAAACGLATLSVPEADLDRALADLLGSLAAASPQGLRETKSLLNQPMLERIAAEGERLVELSARLFASEEAREGMTAFKERRPARWVRR
jgi:enoyl-CoA hydratase/carnithine racemase